MSEFMVTEMAANLSDETDRMEIDSDFGVIGDVGGIGGPGAYIEKIREVGAWAASVSASAGVASAWSGAMQSAASKVGS